MKHGGDVFRAGSSMSMGASYEERSQGVAKFGVLVALCMETGRNISMRIQVSTRA